MIQKNFMRASAAGSNLESSGRKSLEPTRGWLFVKPADVENAYPRDQLFLELVAGKSDNRISRRMKVPAQKR